MEKLFENLLASLVREETGRRSLKPATALEPVTLMSRAGVFSVPSMPFRKEHRVSLCAAVEYWMEAEWPGDVRVMVHREAARQLFRGLYRDFFDIARQAEYHAMQGNLGEVRELLSMMLALQDQVAP